MSVLTRPTALLAGLSVAVTLVAAPGAAHAADATTTLTAAQMTAAMSTVQAATTAASAAGWKSTSDYHGAISGGASIAVDPVDRRLAFHVDTDLVMFDTVFAQGSGFYQRTDDSDVSAALKMIGKPATTYVFTADRRSTLQQVAADYSMNPSTMTVEYAKLAATKTAHDDGSADYRVTDPDGVQITLAVTTENRLSGMSAAMSGMSVSYLFGYGRQELTVPSAAQTVSAAAIGTATTYLAMNATVKQVATDGATATRNAAKGGTVAVARLRELVRQEAAAENRASGVTMIRVKNVTGGAKVWATNPWTKKTVAYTVKASGRKVTVKKA
ncbi:hypothetical protein [Actinoplanes sp. NBRC 101535]|uniref:hypothetical protein n=1 Tax=Actinoplanes sp. NBRC 101535 TaxID=3032196 RepID=UPI0024A0F32D|nr:hypothetical protein [Actinoplanes sp. NBRC 101535]GLY00535.1 hypothetical protein Acsp01_09140 [Actinoplanes sp. NBRC 101535]